MSKSGLKKQSTLEASLAGRNKPISPEWIVCRSNSPTMLLLGIAFLPLSFTSWANEAEAKILLQACSGCHQIDKSIYDSTSSSMPSLVGFSRAHFLQSMMRFRQDKLSLHVMSRIARGYSEAEIQTMALAFASDMKKSAVKSEPR